MRNKFIRDNKVITQLASVDRLVEVESSPVEVLTDQFLSERGVRWLLLLAIRQLELRPLGR